MTTETLAGKVLDVIDSLLDERKVKKVVRKGQKMKKVVCPTGKTVQNGRCVPVSGATRTKRKLSAKRGARTRRGKSRAAAALSTKRSLRIRKASGLK